MLKFKDYQRIKLNEAVKTSDTLKVAKLITSYLGKYVGKAYLYPSLEQYKHGADTFTAITILTGSDTSVRFNWLHGSVNQSSLHSVSINAEGKKELVSFSKDVPLVQILPTVVKILKRQVTTPEFDLYIDDVAEVNEQQLVENVANPIDIVKRHIDSTVQGAKLNLTKIYNEGGSIALKIAKQVVNDSPKAFNGQVLINKNNVNYQGGLALAANSSVRVKVQPDNTAEQWVTPGAIAGYEQEAEDQISYIEKIEDLSNMLKFMVKGATNSVFVAGRGGTGKTQTVEDTLAELGLQDGSGYFKVTGSASPAAIYEVLYKNRDGGILLFDDCDGALDTQDGRNLIKAATDTKHTRKIAWLKKSSAYYDPEEMGDIQIAPEDDESTEDDGPIVPNPYAGLLPRYFDFCGKVVFISNQSINKLDPDGALRTRGMMIELNPTNTEMLQFMELIYNKVRLSEGLTLSKDARKAVVKELRAVIEKSPPNTVNLRLLVRALNLAATGLPDWQRMLRYS